MENKDKVYLSQLNKKMNQMLLSAYWNRRWEEMEMNKHSITISPPQGS
jgi:hypothetical protein